MVHDALSVMQQHITPSLRCPARAHVTAQVAATVESAGDMATVLAAAAAAVDSGGLLPALSQLNGTAIARALAAGLAGAQGRRYGITSTATASAASTSSASAGTAIGMLSGGAMCKVCSVGVCLWACVRCGHQLSDVLA
jgi:hypothetical protein